MPTEHNKRLRPPAIEDVGTLGNLAAGEELDAEVEQETLARTLFRLALTLAAEPSKLGQLRQMLVQLKEQQVIPEGLSSWALGQLDEQVRVMALAYAHDAEILVQLLSFKGGTFAGLLQEIEDLYRQEKISQRVYVRARLLLRDYAPPRPE